MARMPGATQRQTPNYSSPVIRPARGIVLHTASGSYEGTVGWQTMLASQVSSYFVVAKDGRFSQMLDTDYKAWTQGSGNQEWIGIEHEGNTEALTPQQVAVDSRIYEWLVRSGIARLGGPTDSTAGIGVGWHGMGGAAWGGHFSCPGEAIKAQRGAIYSATIARLNGATPPPASKPTLETEMIFAEDTTFTTNAARPRGVLVLPSGNLELTNGANVSGGLGTPALGAVSGYGKRIVPAHYAPGETFEGAQAHTDGVTTISILPTGGYAKRRYYFVK